MKYPANSTIVAGLIASVLVGASGYWAGAKAAEKRIYASNELEAVEQLASTLFMLEQLDTGNLSEVRQILQTSTNPKLDWIAERNNLDADSDPSRFRCRLVQKLKAYREQHQLFEGDRWAYLWKVPDMREAEERRLVFLNQVAPAACGWTTSK